MEIALNKRKAFYFSIDALIAVTLVVSGVSLVMYSPSPADVDRFETTYQRADTLAEDAAQLLMNQRLGSLLDGDELDTMVAGSALDEDDVDGSVLEAIGTLWAANESDEAADLASSALGAVVPDEFGFRVVVDDGNRSLIYNSSEMPDNVSMVARSSRLVSGVAKDRPTEGYTARASLTSVDAVQPRFFRFGGYVGDGNVTANLSLPAYENIVDFVLEGDLGSNASVSVNGVDAGMFNATSGELKAENWTVCNQTVNQDVCNAFEHGNNDILLSFQGNESSISGGFARVRYNESQSLQSDSSAFTIKEHRLPGIDGVVNLFDGFMIPGTLHGMSAELSYDAEARIFLQIGNKTIYEGSGGGDLVFDNETIFDNITDAGMSYDMFSNSTTPFRVGVSDLTTIPGVAGSVDAVAAVNLAGAVNSGNNLEKTVNGTERFVEVILNASRSRGGLTSYNSEIFSYYHLTRNESALKEELAFWENEGAGGPRCSGCGIIRSIGTLLERQNITRAMEAGQEWRYATGSVAADWYQPGFDDSGWSSGEAPLGYGRMARTDIGKQDEYYFRTTTDYLESDFRQPYASLSAAGAVDLYINGEEVHKSSFNHSGLSWDEHLSRWTNVTGMWHVTDHRSTVGSRSWYFGQEEVWHYGGFGKDADPVSGELRTPFVNLSVADQTIRFDTWLNKDKNNDAAVVEIRQPGGSWQEIHAVGETSGWEAVADSQDRDGLYQARFRFETQNPPGRDGEGWYIDNVTFGGFQTRLIDPELMEELDNTIAVAFRPEEQPLRNETHSFDSVLSEGVFVNTTMSDGTVVLASGEDAGEYYSPVASRSRTAGWSDPDEVFSEPADSSVVVEYGTNASGGWSYSDTVDDVSKHRFFRFKVTMERDDGDSPSVEELGVDSTTGGAAFDMKLDAEEFRHRSMVVLSAIDSNQETQMTDVPSHTNDAASDHAVEAACRAKQQHDITVHAINVDDAVEEMNAVADCGGGDYYDASFDDLEQLYEEISEEILEATLDAQRVMVEGTVGDSLGADSRLVLNYSKRDIDSFGQFGLTQESDRFGGMVESPKNGSFQLPSGASVLDASVTSYSSNYWTDRVWLENQAGEYEQVFNLTRYGGAYRDLGEPFAFFLPPDLMTADAVNNVSLDTGFNDSTHGGSPDSQVIYDLAVDGLVGYGQVFNKSEGGTTVVQTDYGDVTISVGSDPSDDWEPDGDAVDNATERLFDRLDTDGDGVVDVQIEDEDIRLDENSLSGIQWLWGPAEVVVEVWR